MASVNKSIAGKHSWLHSFIVNCNVGNFSGTRPHKSVSVTGNCTEGSHGVRGEPVVGVSCEPVVFGGTTEKADKQTSGTSQNKPSDTESTFDSNSRDLLPKFQHLKHVKQQQLAGTETRFNRLLRPSQKNNQLLVRQGTSQQHYEQSHGGRRWQLVYLLPPACFMANGIG